MNASKHFWSHVGEYIGKGDRVAELYHGERGDILRGLSELVGEEGIVFGVDKLNPFDFHPEFRKLYRIPNIHLITAEIPPIPPEVSDLDAVVIREFIWTYPLPVSGRVNPAVYQGIDSALRDFGHLILHINKAEQRNEKRNSSYQSTIHRYLPHFSRTDFSEDFMAFRKNYQR